MRLVLAALNRPSNMAQGLEDFFWRDWLRPDLSFERTQGVVDRVDHRSRRTCRTGFARTFGAQYRALGGCFYVGHHDVGSEGVDGGAVEAAFGELAAAEEGVDGGDPGLGLPGGAAGEHVAEGFDLKFEAIDGLAETVDGGRFGLGLQGIGR